MRSSIADGIYSMGGLLIRDVLDLAEQLDFHLYLDYAHGTTISASEERDSCSNIRVTSLMASS